MFHMGLAMLCMEHTTPLANLKRMRHTRLQTLLQAKLIDTKLIPATFLNLLEGLQKVREYANYVFGGKMATDFENLKQDVAGYYQETGGAFDSAFEFINLVCLLVQDQENVGIRIQTTIGDSIGDDLFDTYLSKLDEKRVEAYLLSRGLTT